MMLIPDRLNYGPRYSEEATGSMSFITLTCSEVYHSLTRCARKPILAYASREYIDLANIYPYSSLVRMYSQGQAIDKSVRILKIPLHRRGDTPIMATVDKGVQDITSKTFFRLHFQNNDTPIRHFPFVTVISNQETIMPTDITDTPAEFIAGIPFEIRNSSICRASEILRTLWSIKGFAILTPMQVNKVISQFNTQKTTDTEVF